MKIEQLQYVLAIYETGSISKAAQKFYMSRPNISNAVKNLENELGFEIMKRGTDGVTFTEKGLLFVQKSMHILKEMEEIQNLAGENERLQFSIVNPNWPPVEDAFIRFCRQVEENPDLQSYRFSIYREYQYEGMRLLNQKKADIAFTISPNLRAPALQQEMRERGLEYRKLWDVPCNVNLSRNHPLAKDPDFSLQKLQDYPFVDYSIEGDRGSPYRELGVIHFINLSKHFRVNSGHMRTKLIAATNAYSVGIAMPPSWAAENNVCCFRIPNFTIEFGCIRRAGEPVSQAEQQFMEFLQDEIKFLDGLT